MKKLLAIIFIGMLILFSGCTDKKVAIVKNGVLKFDKTLTVGEAFDNYKYCKNVKWESFTTDNGREIVQVTCDYDFNNKDNSKESRELIKQKRIGKLEIYYQFEILKTGENQFQLRGEYETVYDKNGKVIANDNQSSIIEALGDLKHIYEDEPLL